MRINPLAAASVLLVLTLFVASLLLNRQAGVGHSAADEVASLRHANSLLQLRVEAYEAERKQHRECVPPAAILPPPPPAATSSTSRNAATDGGSSVASLLAAHSRWDWRSIVSDFLRPWPTISRLQLDAAVAACNGSSMYCQRFSRF